MSIYIAHRRKKSVSNGLNVPSIDQKDTSSVYDEDSQFACSAHTNCAIDRLERLVSTDLLCVVCIVKLCPLTNFVLAVDGLQHKDTVSKKTRFRENRKDTMVACPIMWTCGICAFDTGTYCDCYWQSHDILQCCKQNKQFRQITGNKYSMWHVKEVTWV